MGTKRFLILPAFMLMAALALAQTAQPAKPDQTPQAEQQAKPEPSPQAKPDEAAKPDQPQPAQPPKPMRFRISSGVANSSKIKDVTPRYPVEARQERIQGDVILQATIDTDGKIANLKVVQGDPVLAAAALDAVKQWEYKPYILNGKPVEVETAIRIQFHMR